MHVPEQQVGLRPGQGRAVQEPQCRGSLLRSLQVPEQQAGIVPLHYNVYLLGELFRRVMR